MHFVNQYFQKFDMIRFYFYYISMKIFGLEKLSLVDYDGHLAATIFTGGCNFRCPFCHNADLIKMQNLSAISEEEFFEFLKKRKGLLDSVCISGGEPTLQPDLIPFIKKIKDMGYLVKLDSNGTNFQMLKKLVDEKLVDYVAMDIKNSLEKYPLTAGNKNIDIEAIKKSVNLLKQNVVPYEFRTTLVKSHHSTEDIEEIASWLEGSEKLFLQCFVDNGTCIEKGLEKVDKTEAEKFKDILSKKIKCVGLRGY